MSRSLACGFVLVALFAPVRAEATAPHVVLVVWDGMRPDFVTEHYAPTLNKLAQEGVRFQQHHSVYLSATDVNGTALATGVYPNRSGLYANSELRPGIDARRAIDTADPASIAAGDKATNGKYLSAPTFSDLLRAVGKRVVIAGTKSVALLFDRHNQWTQVNASAKPVTIFAAAPVSPPLRHEIPKLLGPFLVDSSASSAERNRYTTRALTDVLWRDGVPDFSLLWLSEPDLAQHNHAPGSPEALAAIKASDDNLGSVLRALDQKHVRDTTDVLVVSDHGFSTIRRSVDVAELLKTAGFRAAKELSESPEPGDILVVGNGGSVLFYVRDHDRATCERLVEWLQHADFAGAMFTREKSAGTLPLSAIHIDTADAADVVMSFRWSADKNQFGAPGMIDGDWNRKAGEGTHATLSPFDVHNTFVAAGPDFRRGFEDSLPTANIDIAPTILQLLDVKPPEPQDGRVVQEALADFKGELPPIANDTLTAKTNGEDRWQEWVRTSRVGSTLYFDAALGSQLRK